jgi:hypothetical protein
MRIVLPVALLAAAFVAAPASAVPFAPPITIGVTGGTLGVGPEISYNVIPAISLRASATFLGFGVSGPVKDYHYDAHAHISNFGGTVDIHPFLNGFRISAGARATGSNHVDFHGMARTNQTYGGMTFTPEQAGELFGRIKTKSVSPLVTVGYAHTFLPGITLGLDGGVMFHGSPRVSRVDATGELGSSPFAADSLAREIENLRNRVDDYKYYPVLQLSLGYRF